MWGHLVICQALKIQQRQTNQPTADESLSDMEWLRNKLINMPWLRLTVPYPALIRLTTACLIPNWDFHDLLKQ